MSSEQLPMSDHEQQQFRFLSDLARGLEDLQASLLVPDASEIERQSSQQMEACKAFTLLCNARVIAPAVANRLVVPQDLQAIRDRVLHLNRVNLGIIWRSHRSLEIFSCLLTSLSATYDVPRNAPVMAVVPEGR